MFHAFSLTKPMLVLVAQLFSKVSHVRYHWQAFSIISLCLYLTRIIVFISVPFGCALWMSRQTFLLTWCISSWWWWTWITMSCWWDWIMSSSWCTGTTSPPFTAAFTMMSTRTSAVIIVFIIVIITTAASVSITTMIFAWRWSRSRTVSSWWWRSSTWLILYKSQ